MNMMTTLNLRAMVSNENGEAKTTSYAVAEAFGKRHSDVLRAIKNMKCSLQFRERNFAFTLKNNKLDAQLIESNFGLTLENNYMH